MHEGGGNVGNIICKLFEFVFVVVCRVVTTENFAFLNQRLFAK